MPILHIAAAAAGAAVSWLIQIQKRDALVARDYPLLLAGTALSAAFVLAGSFLAEALQAWLDPRLRDA